MDACPGHARRAQVLLRESLHQRLDAQAEVWHAGAGCQNQINALPVGESVHIPNKAALERAALDEDGVALLKARKLPGKREVPGVGRDAVKRGLWELRVVLFDIT